MIKYFCDRCGLESYKKLTRITTFKGEQMRSEQDLCDSCSKKFHVMIIDFYKKENNNG